MDNINELIKKHDELSREHKYLSDNVTLIKSELNARKNELRRLMDSAKEAGFDPNNLANEINRMNEVLTIKLNNFENEINDAKKIVEPMVKELNNA